MASGRHVPTRGNSDRCMSVSHCFPLQVFVSSNNLNIINTKESLICDLEVVLFPVLH